MSTTTTLVLTHTEESAHGDVNNADDIEEKPPREAELFEFNNCSKGIGIKICGGCSLDGEELNGVFIKRILPGGLAEIEGGLERGDQILQVNGDSLEGVTNERALAILRTACASNTVQMVIARDDEAMQEYKEVLDKSNGYSVPCTPVPTDPQQTKFEQERKISSSSLSAAAVTPQLEAGTTLQHSTAQQHTAQQHSHSLQHATPVNTQQPQEGYNKAPVTDSGPRPTGLVYNGDVTPKFPWRGLIPSMASTPHDRGSIGTTQSGSTGSQFSTLPPGEPSPVGVPVLSMLNQAPSDLVFDTINNQASSDSVFIGEGTSLMSQSRKLSLDPCVRLKVEKLSSAIRYLGLEPTLEQEVEMRTRLNIDRSGMVIYGDFVDVVRDMFKLELEQKNIGAGAMFEANDFADLVDPPAFRSESNGGASGVVDHHHQEQLLLENEELRQDNMRLQALLSDKHDELLKIRKESQGEQQRLRSKVHLAAEAQKAARDMEFDYEQVVTLLEGEIAQLKLQLGRQGEEDPIMQRRLAVLTCQLRKAESEKATYKVATEKLLQFAESVHETLSNTEAQSRPLGGAGAKLGKHKRSTQSAKCVAGGARDIIKTVQSLIDTQPLPFGWEETYTSDGMKYYINHLKQVTTWSHPLSNVSHLPIDNDKKAKGSDPKPPGVTGANQS